MKDLLMSFDDFGEASWQNRFWSLVSQNVDLLEYDGGFFLTKELGVTYAINEDNKRKSNINKYERMKQRHYKLYEQDKTKRMSGR